jgi:hypothetical protein
LGAKTDEPELPVIEGRMEMPQATGEGKRNLAVPLPLEEGVCYLVRCKSVDSTFRLADHYAEQGVPVLGASRIFPARLHAHYGLASATLWWISESPGEGHVDPTAVSTLASAFVEFIEDHPDGCVIVLDGIEFISMHIGFTKALRFIEQLNEIVMPRRASILVTIDPDCFEPKEFARLDRFTGGLSDEELREALDTFEVNRSLGGN